MLFFVIASGGVAAATNDRAGRSVSDPLVTASRLGVQARAFLATDPARAAALAQSSGDLAARTSTDPRGRAIAIATSQWIQGEAALRLNEIAVAKPLLAKAYDTGVAEQNGSSLEADILVSRARLESITVEVQSALVDYLSAFQIYKKIGDRSRQAVTLQDIGLLYSGAGNYERALSYYDQSKTTFSGTPTLDLSVANNRAESLRQLGRFGEAVVSYQQALTIAEKLGSPSLEAQVLNNLAFAQLNDGQYAAARNTLERGLRIARRAADQATLSSLTITDAELYLRENKLEDARRLIDAALTQHDRSHDSGRDSELHRTAYQIYKAVGEDDKALIELELYQKIDRDHRELMASATSALMAARFDFDNQKARIALLTQEELRRDIALSRLRARQSEIIVASLLTIITVLLISFLLYLRTLRNSRDRLAKSNVALNLTNDKLEQALEAKTQFLATTSHEIRTPLNGILGMTEVLLADQGMSDWIRQRVSLIHDGGEAMRALVDDLLDMSKMDAAEIVVQRDVVDLPRLLSEVHRFWSTHAESAGLTLSLDSKRAPIMIVEDARRLRQILSNLLSNAVKFTPSGSISMVAEAVGVSGHEHLVIRVADTGIGIPPDSHDFVFEKFTQLDAGVDRKYGGTGLGLSIARNLARAMGGDIDLAPGGGVGTVFTVTLPLERVLAAPASELGQPISSRRLNGMRIVIVESNPIRQSSLTAALERRVEALRFEPAIEDVIRDLDGIDVAIASLPRGERNATSDEAKSLALLAEAAQLNGAHLVVIVDEGVLLAEAGLGAYRASRLQRPVSAARLLEHLEGVFELGNPQPAHHE